MNVDLRLIILGVVLVTCIGLLFYAQTQPSNKIKFDFWDLLVDSNTGRASMDSCITLLYCAVGIWYAASKSLDPTFDADGKGGTFLTMLIGVMVLYRGAKQGIAAYANKPPAPPAPPAQVDQQINVSRDPPPDAPSAPGKLPSAIKRP